MQPEKTNRWEFVFKAMGASVAFIAVISGAIQYAIDRQVDRSKQEMEIKAPFREQQMAMYLEISECASQIANLDVKDPLLPKAIERLSVLADGKLAVVEADKVEESVNHFLEKATISYTSLDGSGKLRTPTTDQSQELKRLARALSITCRAELGGTWGVRLLPLKQRYEK